MFTSDEKKRILNECTLQLFGHKHLSPKQIFKDLYENTIENEKSDFYGSGDLINNFEKEIASILGKEESIFMPSGTMAQQIAMRIYCDEKNNQNIAQHPLAHLEIHEEDGIKILHNIKTHLLGHKDRVFTTKDLQNLDHKVAAVLIELPQREIGGQLPTWEELKEISEYCRSNDIFLHLDGARLWECAPFYKKKYDEICSLFDSVYVSFYKGIGAISGAILAGNKEFISKSRPWLRRHGGNLFKLFPYIISSKINFEKRISKMELYHNKAIEIAKIFNSFEKISTIPSSPCTNMFHIYINSELDTVENALYTIAKKHKIELLPYLEKSNNQIKSELSFGDLALEIKKEEIELFISDFSKLL